MLDIQVIDLLVAVEEVYIYEVEMVMAIYLSGDCGANLGNATAASMGHSVARAVQTDLF